MIAKKSLEFFALGKRLIFHFLLCQLKIFFLFLFRSWLLAWICIFLRMNWFEVFLGWELQCLPYQRCSPHVHPSMKGYDYNYMYNLRLSPDLLPNKKKIGYFSLIFPKYFLSNFSCNFPMVFILFFFFFYIFWNFFLHFSPNFFAFCLIFKREQRSIFP